MKAEPLVSIIIPHYNMVELAIRMLDSVPRRTELEVIMVDDNSTDDITPLKDYISKIAGWKLLTNNTGVQSAGAARNVGLDHSRGRWIVFGDADDTFTPNCWDVMSQFLDSNYDLVYFMPTGDNSDQRHVVYENLIRRYLADSSDSNMTRLKYNFVVPYSKLYSNRLFAQAGVRFDSTICSNDLMGSIKCAYYAKNVLVCEESVYRIHDRHLSKGKSFDKQRIRLMVKADSYSFLKERLTPEELKILQYKEFFLGFLLKEFRAGRSQEEMRQLREILKENDIKIGINTVVNRLKWRFQRR